MKKLLKPILSLANIQTSFEIAVTIQETLCLQILECSMIKQQQVQEMTHRTYKEVLTRCYLQTKSIFKMQLLTNFYKVQQIEDLFI